ncbi:MAG: hypothetical protein ACJA2S_005452, partial [Cyclobacteriaceae bacterium]
MTVDFSQISKKKEESKAKSKVNNPEAGATKQLAVFNDNRAKTVQNMAISHAAETKSSSAYSVGLQSAISNPQSVQTFTDNRSIESSDGLVLQEKADDKAVSSSGPTVQFDSGSAGDDDVKSTGGGDLPPDLQAGIESLSGIS